MDYTNLALSVMTMAVIWHVTATMMIYEALRKRGRKLSFILLRLMAPRYASDYKEITRKETGRAGPLFYHWILSINTVLAGAILLLLDQISR